MHQIVVTVSCRLCPLFPEGEFAVFRYRKMPCFYGESYYFYRIFCMNPLFSPTGTLGAKGDAKWWTSIRCMFDSLRPCGCSLRLWATFATCAQIQFATLLSTSGDLPLSRSPPLAGTSDCNVQPAFSLRYL